MAPNPNPSPNPNPNPNTDPNANPNPNPNPNPNLAQLSEQECEEEEEEGRRGKAAGFLAGGWGDRSTATLSRLSFDMHAELARTLELQSYRRLPTLAVRRRGDDGYADGEGDGAGLDSGRTHVSWLDGAAEAEARLLDADTAQVCPAELSAAMLEAATARGATLLLDEAVGLELAEVRVRVRLGLEF